jgi:hypothetical protein
LNTLPLPQGKSSCANEQSYAAAQSILAASRQGHHDLPLLQGMMQVASKYTAIAQQEQKIQATCSIPGSGGGGSGHKLHEKLRAL